MRVSVYVLAGAAVISCALSISIAQKKVATAHKGPLTSQENLPFPAPVRTEDPKYPPVLTPADELKTFHMGPGYHVELVASDPLIQDPILAEFDGDGRLWVMEMQGFAIGEKMVNDFQPVNDLVILEDTDHDGVYDKKTVFMDHLIMPRAFKILDHNCALVGEPPHLWKACDTNGDLKADTKDEISNTFATQGVIEHGANGLYWGMDNNIVVAEHTWSVAFKGNGKFETVPTLNRGQWGVTQDDAGRIYRDVNTDALFTDYIAPGYFTRNPDVTRTTGLYEPLITQDETSVWPIHPTLGVNRGYRKEVSRPDGSSYYYQGVSSPLVYRGTQLPKDIYGDAFVIDGPTNLVHLLTLKDDGKGNLKASDYYKKGEFLASTDERFRPVSLTAGFDGSVYIIDMYRGVSQDEPIQTDYLRHYIWDHKLWEGIHYGRIFRVVADNTKPVKKPAMIEEKPAQLVANLSNPDGWWRDTAQQLLVQRNDKSTVPALIALAKTAPDFRTRIQAGWTLQGMGSMTPEVALAAMDDKSPEVRASGLRFAEQFLATSGPVKAAMIKKEDDPNWQVRRQLAASLGEMPKAERVTPVVAMISKYSDDKITVDAAVSSLTGQETDAVVQLATQAKVNTDALTQLAGAVGKSRDVQGTQKVLALAVDPKLPQPVRLALLQGAAAGLAGGEARGSQVVATGKSGVVVGNGGNRRRGNGPTSVEFPAEPAQLVAASNGKDELATSAKQALDHITWPGKPAPVVPKGVQRTAAEDKLFTHGQEMYTSLCAGCHMAEGQGAAHIAVPLAGSKIVVAGAEIPVRVLVNGKEGSVGTMPAMGSTMSDEDLASVLTYIRGSWGNTAAPIHPAEVDEYRQMNTYRKTPWTDQELLAAPRRGGGGPPGGGVQ
jgi:mono/diheme cytochrome c family protein